MTNIASSSNHNDLKINYKDIEGHKTFSQPSFNNRPQKPAVEKMLSGQVG